MLCRFYKMSAYLTVLHAFISSCVFIAVHSGDPPPNIILIIADDLGWNDIGFHGSNEFSTPNIDALAYNSVILDQYYLHPMCTPSRAALLTGCYATRLGLQSLVLFSAEKRGLPLKHKLLPAYLKDLGYRTALVGKWHLGHFTKEYTPTFRGFDSHIGYWTGHQDYYEHTAEERDPDPAANQSIRWYGLDMRRNMDVAHDLTGQYTTHIITNESLKIIKEHDRTQPLFLQISHAAPHAGNPWDPLRAPADTLEKFNYIKDPQRRRLAAVISELDDSIGATIDGLEKSGLLSNSIIIFSTDNGGTRAPGENSVGSNWPLRGEKTTVWEGGVRGVGFIWSPQIKELGRISKQKIHVSDWLPTLYAAAGGKVSDLPICDGINQWESLKEGRSGPRHEILHNIDEITESYALTNGHYKIVLGGSVYGSQNGFYGDSGREAQFSYDVNRVAQSQTAKVTNLYRSQNLAITEFTRLRRELTVNCSQSTPQITCSPYLPCLFNLKKDPCEEHNIALLRPDKLIELEVRLALHRLNTVPPSNEEWDIRGNPIFWNNTWTNFGDYITS